MEEISSQELSGSEAVGSGEWLLPGAALSRFQPPEGMVVAAAAEEKRGRYGFKISTLNFLIKPGCASEVLRAPDIWDLPGSVPWLLGLVNLRSNLVPVFDLRREFGLPMDSVADTHLVLVFDQGEKAVGLLINDFPKPLFDMTHLPALPQLPAELQAHVRGGYMKDDNVWLEFDHESFFEELARSAE